MFAALLGEEAIVRALLRGGAGAGAAGIGNLTALHFASERGFARICHILLKAGADISARMDKPPPRSTPLHVACRNTRLSCVLTLLGAGADETLGDETPARPGRGGAALAGAAADEATSPLLLPTKPIDVIGLGKFRPGDDADQLGQSETEEDRARRRDSQTMNLIRVALRRAPANRAWRRRSWLVMVKMRHAKTAAAMTDAAAVAAATRKSLEGQRAFGEPEVDGNVGIVELTGSPALTMSSAGSSAVGTAAVPPKGTLDQSAAVASVGADQLSDGNSDTSGGVAVLEEATVIDQRCRSSIAVQEGKNSDKETCDSGVRETMEGCSLEEKSAVAGDAMHHKRARQDPPPAEGAGAGAGIAGLADGENGLETGEEDDVGEREQAEAGVDVEQVGGSTEGSVAGGNEIDSMLLEICERLFALSEVVEGAFRRVVSFL